MNARRVTAFVESLRRNRRPKAFTATPDDVEVMRAAIELNNATAGAAIPDAEFVSDLHRRLADQLNEADAPVDLYVNQKRIAHGEVVVVEDRLGIKITKVIGSQQP